MNELRSYIRKVLKESVISEGAKTFLDVPPFAGIVTQQVSTSLTDVSLFDFSTKRCIGNISLVKISDRAYSINTAGANEGFGPLMYEMAMMQVYPAAICSDRGGNTTTEALAIWKKFYDVRGDVKKQVLKKGEPEYKDRFEQDDNNYIVNCLYSRPRSTWFNKATERGEKLRAETKIPDDKIFNVCANFFHNKYANRK